MSPIWRRKKETTGEVPETLHVLTLGDSRFLSFGYHGLPARPSAMSTLAMADHLERTRLRLTLDPTPDALGLVFSSDDLRRRR